MSILDRVSADKAFAARYTLEDRIGAGGMGEVFRASQMPLGRTVAIKFLAPDLVRDPQYRERFQAEAKLASELVDTNVVAVFDFGYANDVPFLVTEYVKGEPLSNVLRQKGELAPELVKEIGGKLIDGLGAIHQLGIVHRDIKPENLLVQLGPPVALKIADFGIAKGSGGGGPKTAAGIMLGTPAYMAPEQVLGDPLKPATDLYAVGLILYTMIVGQHPFPGDEAFDVVRRQVHEAPAIPNDLYRSVRDFLARSLAKRTADRFESAHEMRAQFDQIMQMAVNNGSFRRDNPTAPGAGAPLGSNEGAKWQLGESGIRKAAEIGMTRMRAAPGQAALAAVPGGLAAGAAAAGRGGDPAEPGHSGVGKRAPMQVLGGGRGPAAKAKRSAAMPVALALFLIVGGAAAVWLNWPLIRPEQRNAQESPGPAQTVALPELTMTGPVRAKLASHDPEAAALIFKYVDRDNLNDVRFTTPQAAALDRVLLEALEELPVEMPPDAKPAPAKADKGAARHLCALAACLKPPLSDEAAKRFASEVDALVAESKGGVERLPAGNVLDRLAAAFRTVNAPGPAELAEDIAYLMLAVRVQGPVQIQGWSARIADAVLGPLTPAGQMLADTSAKGGAARETEKLPRIAGALSWLEQRLRETSKTVAPSAQQRCRVRKYWLGFEMMVRAETQAKRRSQPDWAVPRSVPAATFRDLEGMAADTEALLDGTLHNGSMDLEKIEVMQSDQIVPIARFLGCTPNLVRCVEEDSNGCQ